MTASDTPPPLTDERLAGIRERFQAVINDRKHKLHLRATDMLDLLNEVDRLRAEVADAPSRRDLLVAEEIARSCEVEKRKAVSEADRLRAELATVSDEAGVQCLEAAARTVRAEKERDALKRQIDWLAEWLTQHTDEPKGSYGAVEAAINAMAGFQRHINRSAEVWAENRAELEKLRAENTALAAKLAAVQALHRPTDTDPEDAPDCETCNVPDGYPAPWPCETAAALGESGTTDPEEPR